MPARRARTGRGSERTFAPDHAHERGHQGQRGQHGDRDDERGGQAERADERDPEMYRPRMETTTVLPATTTAAPEVLSACPAEVTMSMPASSCSRCRATRNRP